VFFNQSCSFFKEFFFVLPKLRVLIPGFYVTETLEYRKFEIIEFSGENELLCVQIICDKLIVFIGYHLPGVNIPVATFAVHR
jgi:hypothetical protein